MRRLPQMRSAASQRMIERFADALSRFFRAELGLIGDDRIASREEPDCMLAVTASDVDEFIENLGFLDFCCVP